MYRATQDGFSSSNFHSKCNGKARTLTIIQTTNGNIFGGFTNAAWSSSAGYVTDTGAFVFSLINNENKPRKFQIKNGGSAIYNSNSYGPTFGGGHDIRITDNSNINSNSLSNLGYSYDSLYTYGTNEARSFLAGSYNFQVREIEVFQI